MNYLMKIEYDGTKFVGWQYQKKWTINTRENRKSIIKVLKKTKIMEQVELTDKVFMLWPICKF